MKRLAINRKTIGSDLVAGLTLGIESVPDSMAAAVLAGELGGVVPHVRVLHV